MTKYKEDKHMPGRRSKMPIEQKITKVRDQIALAENKVCRLKLELQELNKKYEQVKVKELYELIQESDISIDDLRDLINNNTHIKEEVNDNKAELCVL